MKILLRISNGGNPKIKISQINDICYLLYVFADSIP